MLLIKITKNQKRFRAYPTHQAVQTTGSTALSNERNLRQSDEIKRAIDLIDRLRSKVSDQEWAEVCEDNNEEFAEVDLVSGEDGD